MRLIRALLMTGREAVEAGVDKALGPPPPSAVHPGAPLPPQPVHDPAALLEEYLKERKERDMDPHSPRQERNKNNGGATGGRGGPMGRLNLVIGMARDAEQREIHAMRSAALWGVSMIIVGFIFMILVITGVFPTSVDNLKAMGIYDDYIVQYCLSMVAGLAAFTAAATARRGLRAGRSTVAEQGAFLLAMLIALGLIGLSIWLDVTVNNFESSMWWVWLILVLIICQRGFFAIACAFSIWTLRLAASRVEMESSYDEGKSNAVTDVV